DGSASAEYFGNDAGTQLQAAACNDIRTIVLLHPRHIRITRRYIAAVFNLDAARATNQRPLRPAVRLVGGFETLRSICVDAVERDTERPNQQMRSSEQSAEHVRVWLSDTGFDARVRAVVARRECLDVNANTIEPSLDTNAFHIGELDARKIDARFHDGIDGIAVDPNFDSVSCRAEYGGRFRLHIHTTAQHHDARDALEQLSERDRPFVVKRFAIPRPDAVGKTAGGSERDLRDLWSRMHRILRKDGWRARRVAPRCTVLLLRKRAPC